jgi:hypothetical protein
MGNIPQRQSIGRAMGERRERQAGNEELSAAQKSDCSARSMYDGSGGCDGWRGPGQLWGRIGGDQDVRLAGRLREVKKIDDGKETTKGGQINHDDDGAVNGGERGG